MARNKPDRIISGAGWLTQFAAGVILGLRERGVTDEEIHRLGTQAGVEDMERGIEAYCKAITGPNLDEFFTTREGLEVSFEFRERILVIALGIKGVGPATIGNSFDLPRGMSDNEILGELGNGYIFENSRSFLSYLVGAINRQWGGKGGDFLNNGYANLFYVRGIDDQVFVVIVCWHAGDRRWRVYANRLGDYQWSAGGRAFSATADTKST